MVKKAASDKSDRSDPRQNKSLAIRHILKKLPKAKAKEVAATVKQEYGHDVSQNQIYMVKTKSNMASNRRATNGKAPAAKASPITTTALWVEAIKMGRQLLKATGSVENATALLKAIDG